MKIAGTRRRRSTLRKIWFPDVNRGQISRLGDGLEVPMGKESLRQEVPVLNSEEGRRFSGLLQSSNGFRILWPQEKPSLVERSLGDLRSVYLSSPHNVIDVLFLVPIMLPEQ